MLDPDFEAAIERYCDAHPPLAELQARGVEMRRSGAEWHSVTGCPLAGCGSTHDAFRVHPQRSRGDPTRPQWACRKCGGSGDALKLAMLLDGADPAEPGATARYLRERGYLEAHGLQSESLPSDAFAIPLSPPSQAPRNAPPPRVTADAVLAALESVDSGGSGPNALRSHTRALALALADCANALDWDALDIAEYWSERAAIREFDTCEPRASAERNALADAQREAREGLRKASEQC